MNPFALLHWTDWRNFCHERSEAFFCLSPLAEVSQVQSTISFRETNSQLMKITTWEIIIHKLLQRMICWKNGKYIYIFSYFILSNLNPFPLLKIYTIAYTNCWLLRMDPFVGFKDIHEDPKIALYWQIMSGQTFLEVLLSGMLHWLCIFIQYLLKVSTRG